MSQPNRLDTGLDLSDSSLSSFSLKDVLWTICVSAEQTGHGSGFERLLSLLVLSEGRAVDDLCLEAAPLQSDASDGGPAIQVPGPGLTVGRQLLGGV